ncbi:MAG: hypothetical protein LBG83_03650 [Oscillospiraceae bacterium]|nr:hypothetical protein [Oscillospiraceae bacterium]
MMIPQRTTSLLRLCLRRRWALFFLNLVAGLFAAPFLYWRCLLMPMALNAVHSTSLLLGLNTFDAIGGLLLLLLAALGVGGCCSAIRRVLADADLHLIKELGQSIGACAGTSLFAGCLLGLSLGLAQVGLIHLHALLPAGAVRILCSALLCLQLPVVFPLSLLMLSQPDALQKHPLRAFAAAARQLAGRPLRWLALSLFTILPALLFFVWRRPLPTFLGFLFFELAALSPIAVLWQEAGREPQAPQQSGKRRVLAPAVCALFPLLACVPAIVFSLLRQANLHMIQASFRQAIDFIAQQALLSADNGTFRALLSSSSAWPLMFAALLGSACCVITAYVCACYRFPARAIVFAAAVLLQMLPMLSGFPAFEQAFRNWRLPVSTFWFGVLWALLYLLAALLLYRRFRKLLPSLEARTDSGMRLFFYYALPRARYWVISLMALVTLGFWGDALAPFWLLRELGAFSVAGYVLRSFGG